jgi:integrase/recombinase XerD
MQAMKVEQALDEFLIAVAADGRAPKTVSWYRERLQSFVARYLGQNVNEIRTPMVRQYIVSLRQRETRYNSGRSSRPKVEGGLSKETVNASIRALHRFWNWCSREYGLEVNPMANIDYPPRLKQEPKAISTDDLRALFQATGSDAVGSRDRAILAFLMDTGCRAQGLIGLLSESLDMREKRAIVTEKGDKPRPVFFSDVTAQLLTQWLEQRPKGVTAVFCSLSGNTYGNALTYDGLKEILRRLKKRAGVKGRVNPHSFRHAFAREYIRNGGDVATLSRIMGHSDAQVTTHYYLVFSSEELAESHRKFSPVKKMGLSHPSDDDEPG